jgi:tetratricopeptide (TPR) repeat protein
MIVLCIGSAACSAPLTRVLYTRPEATPLSAGDAYLVAGDYRSAIDEYERFLRENPANPDASRVRATRAILALLAREGTLRQELQRTIAIREAELERASTELSALQDRLTSQETELERLQLSSFQIWRVHEIREDQLHRVMAALAEAQRAKKDLELLKSLDLQLEQRVR